MPNLLERNIRAIDSRLVLLAPSGATVPAVFRNRDTDEGRHREFVREMQHLRGSIYLRDGAVERRRLAPDGSHRTPEDEKSWHLLMLNADGRVSACGWYLLHGPSVTIDSLRVRTCPLSRTEGARDRLWSAVTSEIARSRREGLGYAELGGWAAAEESGSAAEGLVLALAGYSLARVCGGALGITTATVRHCSSTILRKLGGSPLEFDGWTVPSYYDASYRCRMELLRFDSRHPNPRYIGLIEQLQERLADVLVLARPADAAATPTFDVSKRRIEPAVSSLAA
jgi:hypothetical protein